MYNILTVHILNYAVIQKHFYNSIADIPYKALHYFQHLRFCVHDIFCSELLSIIAAWNEDLFLN